MSDTDEIRAALSDAVRLPGEVHLRPGAAVTIRARARTRRRAAVAAFAVGVPVCVVLVALVMGIFGSGGTTTSTPATSSTPRVSVTTSTEIRIAPGPRQLASPIEFRPVLKAYVTCPADAQTVPDARGSGCYQLGPAAMVVRKVDNLSASVRIGADATIDGITMQVTLTTRDAARFSTLTGASIQKQLAFVMNGKVETAPVIQDRITGGTVEFIIDESPAQLHALMAALTG